MQQDSWCALCTCYISLSIGACTDCLVKSIQKSPVRWTSIQVAFSAVGKPTAIECGEKFGLCDGPIKIQNCTVVIAVEQTSAEARGTVGYSEILHPTYAVADVLSIPAGRDSPFPARAD
jgi:hypothetical protein